MSEEGGHVVEFFQVDAFTADRFRGNPAAVVLPEDRLPDGLCQRIAAEMNLSETAFIHPVDRKEDDIPRFGLRWFTPKVEVDLCGHATLATAKVIFKVIGVDSEVLAFDTKSGPLFAHRVGTAVRLDFPSNAPDTVSPPKGLFEAMGIEGARNVEYSKDSRKVLVELDDEDAVKAVRPDFNALLQLEGPPDVKGLIVTAKGGNPFGDGPSPDFVSRFFCPWWGIEEDPVTGAAHTVLGPYWTGRLGKSEMRANQISERGGELIVKVEGDRVHLTGEAVVVMDGTIHLG